MLHNPLRSPDDDRLLRLFARHIQLVNEVGREELLQQLIEGFSHLPYENLSKIVCFEERQDVPQSRRTPQEVIEDHVHWGTGGTCFSLTATLLHLVRSLGFQAEPILADRKYGPNTHCAMLVWMRDAPHLVDPGFLINRPILLPTTEAVTVPTRFNELRLEPRLNGALLDLFTLQQSKKVFRVTFKTGPVDAAEFLRVWDESFDWEMMHYPLVTQVIGEEQRYLHGERFQVRSRASTEVRRFAREQLAGDIATNFGIDATIVAKALAIWKKQGDLRGS